VVIYTARPCQRQHSGTLGKGNEHSNSHSPGRLSIELSISRANTSRDSLLISMQGPEARRGSLFYTSISQDLLYLAVEEPQSNPAIHRSYRHNAEMSAFTQRRQIRLTAHPSCAPFSLTLTPSSSPSLTTSPSHSQYHPKRPHPEACKFAHQASTAYPSLLRLASRIS
jgi:hypothetical protein